MITKPLNTALAAVFGASAVLSPAAAAADELGAALLGAVVGGVVVNEVHKNKNRQRQAAAARSSSSGSAAYSATRQANRETQTALNYFGFPAGTPDGVIGPRSRSAIAQYQAYMGYPATGQLTEYERNFLTASFARAQIGGVQVAQAMQQPQGTRGLLRTWQQEAAGGAAAPVEATAPVATAAEPQGLGGVQLFDTPDGTGDASLASFCSRVGLLTSSNGGYATLASMRDPQQALGEQFCLARTYAIGDGETRLQGIQGVTQAQADGQCDSFVPALAPYVARLPLEGSAAVLADTQTLVVQSGMPLEKLKTTAAVCLFSGYRRDRMDVALSAALILAGSGRRPYAELVGHHLVQGFGTSRALPRAQDWYNVSVTALEAGAEPAFAPGQPERTQLIRTASEALGRNALVQPVPASGGITNLPVIGSD